MFHPGNSARVVPTYFSLCVLFSVIVILPVLSLDVVSALVPG